MTENEPDGSEPTPPQWQPYQPPPPAYGAPPPYSAPPPYGAPPPAYGAPPPYQQSLGTATTAMVLGIVSLASIVSAPFLCGLTLPGAFTGPFAIWLGPARQREIDREPGRYGNRSHAVAGLVCGIIGTALVLLGLAGLAFLFTWNVSGTPL